MGDRPHPGRESELTADYASAWQAADKVVYSSTLAAHTAKLGSNATRPQRGTRAEVAAAKDLLLGGPNLAAQAVVAGLVDELALFVWPVILGGRNPALPTDRASIWSSSTSTDSAAASSTSATAFSRDAKRVSASALPQRRVRDTAVGNDGNVDGSGARKI